MKIFLKIALLGAIFALLIGANVFAETKSVTLKDPIIGDGKVKNYEITLVAKASPIPSPNYKKLSTSTASTEKYEVYIEGNANSLIRGVQVFSYDMKSIKLEFYDQGYLVDQQDIETDGGLLSERYSMPTHSNTVVIKVKPFKDGVNAVFKLQEIRYMIDTKETANSTISYTAIKEFINDKEMLSFRKVFGGGSITSLVGDEQYNRATGGVLFVASHSNGDKIYTDTPNNDVELASLYDNESGTDWILQKSCYAVNLRSALDWRNYFTSNLNHFIKGVFGVSGSYNSLNWSKDYINFAKKRALLSVTMNENAKKFNEHCTKPADNIDRINHDTLAYTTVLINEKNIFDSMFEITSSNSDPSRYRLYRFQRSYGTYTITPESLGLVNVEYALNSTTNKYIVTYSFTKNNRLLNIQLEKASLEAGNNPSEIEENEKKYLANYLNNLDIKAFDELMRKSQGQDGYGFRMMDVIPEINELKKEGTEYYNPGAYKQWILHWLTLYEGLNTVDKQIASVPLVESIKCDALGYPEVEYAVISLQNGSYKFETTDGVTIKWNRGQYFKDHPIRNGVPLK
ncbi:hypothetical protein [Pseudobacteroides cellulosolvens]|uniref:Cellulosome anchoring protein cohesin region n=1 Tax=Pseudobacteroides cellulosolvens ATCC 35603 = DSM 2933 TaxID=398512 RepID=A0A0L6JNA9_9FIRM|nr:hypothetical protein [Pseudobacteroides cellulosolvens]KNY27210.1 hypothetical protein Bccel_2478 [Pseudobacteroides cellulosolvens ATCC 35603 = DSM 2933]